MSITTFAKQRNPSTVSGLTTFRLPRSIFNNNCLIELSAHALSLFITASYRAFKERSTEVTFSARDLSPLLRLSREEILEAAQDLSEANIMDCLVSKDLYVF